MKGAGYIAVDIVLNHGSRVHVALTKRSQGSSTRTTPNAFAALRKHGEAINAS